MLTVYSTQGSPGASTTTIHLAAQWASMGREVLLIEADPAGGSLSHNLGVQFTPGAASFVASGLPVMSQHLIDHAQDVLFDNLHVMPAPSNPTGARGVVETFANSAEELRDISESELAVIVDGGRITAETATSSLMRCAAGVVVVSRDNTQLPSLDHLRGVFVSDPADPGPLGCAVTVGKSPLSAEEWQERSDLTFCGSIELVPDMTGDLTAFLERGKRKSRKWRGSLERVGESLFEFAFPASAESPRLRLPRRAAPSASESPNTAGAASVGPAPGAPAPPVPAPPPPPPPAPAPPLQQPAAEVPQPPVAPPAYAQAPPLAAPPSPAPPAAPAPAPHAYPPAQPAHFPPQQPPWTQPPPYSPEPQPTAPDDLRAPYGQAVRQPPPFVPSDQQHPGAPAQHRPSSLVGEQPAPPRYDQPVAPAAAHRTDPVPDQTPAFGAPQTPEVRPTGSFRDWAAELHGVDVNGNRRIPPAASTQSDERPPHTAGLDG